MNDKQLKEEFIKYFGEEKWNEEESLAKLQTIEEHLSQILLVERIPVLTEDIEEDSRYMIQDNYIIISNKIIHDQFQAIKALVHEYKHYHQFCIVENNVPHPLLNLWLENFKNPYQPQDFNDSEQMTKYYLQPIELDAFAFTKYYFHKYLNQSIQQLHEDFEHLFDLYISKYYK